MIDRRGMLIGVQGLLAGAALLLAAVPPADGPMLVIAFGSLPAAALLSGEATLLGRGPLPGSIIVRGSRARLMPGLLAGGALAFAAPSIICGRRTA